MVPRGSPGHTIGQMQVRLASAGAIGIFTADCLHQPMQVYRPEWSTRFCESASGAVKTRELLLSAAADDGAVLFPSHFGAPHAGTIVRRAGGYRFVPLGEAA